MQNKIKSLSEIQETLENHRQNHEKIVHCHGVFDLLHPGHIRHFKNAKEQGNILVVTITPDRFVNKGPGRPAFNERLRLESLAALDVVDYVVLNETPDAVHCIEKIKPDVYVKGKEYENHNSDVTGKIQKEVNAAQYNGGIVHYTDDIVFSSSSLLNRFFDPLPPNVQKFIRTLKEKYSISDVLQKVEDLANLRVLVVGDAIIDEYQYAEPLGQSGKGLHMSACLKEREVFLGGSLIVANHIAQFSNHVTLLTAVGKECPYREFIQSTLDEKIGTSFIEIEKKQTLTKKRYVLKDGKALTKLFEAYSNNDPLLSPQQSQWAASQIRELSEEFDLILVCDFGNGFMSRDMISVLSDVPTFLAINTQTNSGNRGFNVVSHYKRADFISLNEPELRLAAHDRYSALEGLVEDISQIMNCQTISVTRGVNGVACFSSDAVPIEIPALISNFVDRVGAGDSYFAISSLCAAKNYDLLLVGFLGSIAAAMDVQIIGNKEPVKKAPFCKFLTRLLK